MSTNELSPERLKQFRPFAGLDSHQLLLLSRSLTYRQVPEQYQLFEIGDIDSDEFFLLRGEIALLSEDGVRHTINAEHPTAHRQIARLRPRQFTAVTTVPSELIIADADVIEAIQQESTDSNSIDDGYGVNEVDNLEEAESQELLSGFKSALKRNQFVLPSLPEVALKVRKLLQDENSNADKIASAVNADPSIAAKLIRAANSPIYHGATLCDSTRNSIVRLGLETTRQLVVSFALKDLFSSASPELHKHMLKAWRHSVEVASISFVIARMVKDHSITPEEALLAGLVHDIGVIAILAYVDTRPEIGKSPEQLTAILEKLRADVGEMILRQWHFPDEIITAAKSSADWQRKHPFKADLCDIVQIAKLHSFIRNKVHLPVERIDEVPAFDKLPLGELTPQLTIHILDEAREQIASIKQILNS